MSIYIFEGSDKVGKTTAANQLSKERGIPIIKCSQPTGDPYREYVEKILALTEDVIFDRFLYGELVYGPLYRKRSQLNDIKVYNLELLLQVRDTMIIHCNAKIDFVKKKFISENETFTRQEDIEKILNGYKELFKSPRLLPVIHRTIPTDEPLTLPISRSIPTILLKTRYIGSLQPSVVFVGDRNNQRAQGRYAEIGLPFDFGRSSTILRGLIKDVGIKSFGMTNVYKHHLQNENQRKILQEEIETIHPRVLIALGNKAASELKSCGFEPKVLWHPSFLGRFKGAQRPDYIKKLIEICQ